MKRRPGGWDGAFVFATLAALACDEPPPKTEPAARPAPVSSASASVAAVPQKRPDEATRYRFDSTFSAIDEHVARRFREIAARDPTRRSDAFAKIGDSITASGNFLHCFSRPDLELGEHAELAATVQRFRGLDGGADSFRRQSLSARVGWSAWQALAGGPSQLELELQATRARFAFVMFGTNDLEIGNLHSFADRLFDIVDFAVEKGVIPILFTIPSRRDREDRDVWVPRYNAVVRGIAQARQVPLADYHRELSRLPNDGLAGDGIHPNTFHGRSGRAACALHAEGLRHGYNLRNLLALTSLDRAVRALEGRPSDGPQAGLKGAGNPADPIRIESLPFVDRAPFDAIGLDRRTAPACRGARSTRGAELSYQLELKEPTAVRIMGFDRGIEVDLALVRGEPGSECLAQGERVIEAKLAPGSYRIVLSAVHFRAGAGDTLITVLREH